MLIAAKPREKIHQKESSCINCGPSHWTDVCSATALDYTDRACYFLKRCDTCGLVRTVPRPNEEQIALSYSRGAYASRQKMLSRLLERLTLAWERKKLRRLAVLTEGRTLLDIGSGKGRFVRVANDGGWNAYGFEPYQESHAPAKYRERFFGGDCEHLPLPDNSVDVVTMWHVLEHVPDPLATVQRVARYLKDDGVLVIAVPNFDGGMARAAQGLWYHLDVPRHLWHFSARSLAPLLASAGYHVAGVNYQSDQNLVSLWMSLGNLFKCVPNYPWNVVRRNPNMLKHVSIGRLIYSTVVHALLVLSLPLLYVLSRILCLLKRSETFEIYAYKKPLPAEGEGLGYPGGRS